MARHRSVDVLIVGAGPAGCAAALTLAQAGVATTLLEGVGPTGDRGELLAPGALPVLDELGMPDLGSALRGALACRGITLATADASRSTRLPFRGPGGWLVDHSRLEGELRSAVLRTGAEILPELVATTPTWEGTRLTGVLARAADGRDEAITCKALLDASGRKAFLSNRMGWAFPYPRHRRAMAWASYSGVTLPDWAPRDHQLLVAMLPGFLWLTPLDSGRVTVGAVLDRRTWEECGASAERLLGKALGASPPVDWLLAKADESGPTNAIASVAFRVLDVAGHGYCLIGDAAGYLDPVVPHGLLAALLTGRSAGLDVADALLHRGRVTAVDFGPTVTLTRMLQRQQIGLVHELYGKDLLAVLLAGHQHLGARAAFVELVAGHVQRPRRWRRLAHAWMLTELAELQRLTRHLGSPIFEPI
ncbi:MAG TPA: FAD-dependent monooxygenase [Thermoanaerobaculaceae bacterium]|nr:FAD-dependent monooxygenase [Thermoanaerobaculaceae bacterium]HPS77297.1 FAD-dependent monooxygenase [Thermoanaerobaculaceae bacterium]